MGEINNRVIFVGFMTLIYGLEMSGVSSWVLHNAIHMRQNLSLETANELLQNVNKFFGDTLPKYDLDLVYQLMIGCSIAALVGGVLQVLSSFCLILCGATGYMRKPFAVLWIGVKFLALIGVGGALISIWTSDIELNNTLKIFTVSAGFNVILTLVNCMLIAFHARDIDMLDSDFRDFTDSRETIEEEVTPLILK